MSTHATIGIKQGDKVKAVHLHYDGYPSNVLPELVKHYDTEEKVMWLLSKGRIHEIYRTNNKGDKIGCATFVIDVQPFGRTFDYISKDPFLNVSSFIVDYQAYKDIDFEKFNHCEFESMYYYLFEDGEWNFSQLEGDFGAMHKEDLTDEEYKLLRDKYVEEAA